MKISISKKILMLVCIPIILICCAAGYFSAVMIEQKITDEIEKQLLQEYAEEKDLTVSQILRRLIKEFLDAEVRN